MKAHLVLIRNNRIPVHLQVQLWLALSPVQTHCELGSVTAVPERSITPGLGVTAGATVAFAVPLRDVWPQGNKAQRFTRRLFRYNSSSLTRVRCGFYFVVFYILIFFLLLFLIFFLVVECCSDLEAIFSTGLHFVQIQGVLFKCSSSSYGKIRGKTLGFNCWSLLTR